MKSSSDSYSLKNWWLPAIKQSKSEARFCLPLTEIKNQLFQITWMDTDWKYVT